MPRWLAASQFWGPTMYEVKAITDDPTYGCAHLHALWHANVNAAA